MSYRKYPCGPTRAEKERKQRDLIKVARFELGRNGFAFFAYPYFGDQAWKNLVVFQFVEDDGDEWRYLESGFLCGERVNEKIDNELRRRQAATCIDPDLLEIMETPPGCRECGR